MLLLDTCTFLWLMEDSERLSKVAREEVEYGNHQLFLSGISALEIGTLSKKKKILLPLGSEEWLKQSMMFLGIEEIPITIPIACRATELKLDHQDLADRIIIATALEKKLKILTPDEKIRQYRGVKVLW